VIGSSPRRRVNGRPIPGLAEIGAIRVARHDRHSRNEGHHQDLPGVNALDNVNMTVEARRDPRAGGRERRRQVDADEGLSGVYPHGDYDGQIFFDGEERSSIRSPTASAAASSSSIRNWR
jgi:hypothetical protein